MEYRREPTRNRHQRAPYQFAPGYSLLLERPRGSEEQRTTPDTPENPASRGRLSTLSVGRRDLCWRCGHLGHKRPIPMYANRGRYSAPAVDDVEFGQRIVPTVRG
ncbi:hypothetical protein JTB14_021064 [Gonioctena quinquepunctata]|nr:hypothetical protein JTB14_021064 [Gonioctena quinquepunctata]